MVKAWLLMLLVAAIGRGQSEAVWAQSQADTSGGKQKAKVKLNDNAKIKVGSDAPDWELQGSDGKTYKLSDFKGKQAVVVSWYPKALTGG